MAKYVCDFDQVKSAGDKLCSAADEMGDSVTTYSTNIFDDNNLASWTGPASDSFREVSEQQVEETTSHADDVRALGEFIQKVVEAIQSLEEELAGLSI